MSRLFHFLRDAASMIAAAGQASAALQQHKMPAEADLNRLGISKEAMARVHF